jgi:hypothetical protein
MPHEMIFSSTERSKLNTELIVGVNGFNEVFIDIFDSDNPYDSKCISLEKDSAIKLAKELRKQISFLEGDKI